AEDAVWNARLAGQFRHADRRPGGEFRWLQNHGAAGPYRPRHALGGDDERKIPGRDNADHADRFAQHEAEAIVADIVVALAFERAGLAGGVGPEVGAEANFTAGLGDRLANLQALGE